MNALYQCPITCMLSNVVDAEVSWSGRYKAVRQKIARCDAATICF